MSGYKSAYMAILTVFYLIISFNLLIVFYDGIEEIDSVGLIITGIMGLLLFMSLVLIKEKYFLRHYFRFKSSEKEPDYFMIYAAKIISFDAHFSEKKLNKVKKYMAYNYGEDRVPLRLKNLKVLIDQIDWVFPKFHIPGDSNRRVDKLRLLQNVVGLATTDRFLSNKELDFIKETVRYFNLTDKDLQVVLDHYNFVTEEETEYQRLLKAKPKRSFQKAYSILGLDSNATLQEVKDSYRELVKIHHPDKIKDKYLKEKAKEQFQVITEAYEHIKQGNR